MTFQQDADNLNKAWLDLWYLILTNIGIVRLTERLGMTPRPWIAERKNSNT